MVNLNLFQGLFHVNESANLTTSSKASAQMPAYVDEAISPDRPGRVRYQATYWFGVCQPAQALPPGTEVTVISRRGNTLIVKPKTTGCLESTLA